MSVTSILRDNVMFAPDTPSNVNAILQEAVALYNQTERAEEALWEAYKLAPDRLEVYVALYKFYFYKNRLSDAEEVAMLSLQKAAELGGFSYNWKALNADTCQWTPAPDAHRFYLYTLKALAFINLRLERNDAAAELVAKLRELDPEDQVGGSVIGDLLAAMMDD